MRFPGVILILFLKNTTLSTTSMMGIIMVFGVVVLNGVLLVDYTNVLRRGEETLHGAVVTAARTRLRPILMTSLATVLGLFLWRSALEPAAKPTLSWRGRSSGD